ncbi:uncharacterized protein MAL13P1.304 [Manduca sexta]|uniref:Uncharacterized protein n=1 Tax=Manduca sexta TaxID=7130 RepID=A0A921ZE27_MANSE|nr:uncharacterized protein MAL13P1.304 [Manduca sexta]KAG6455845.1 hypothetical protein O3G_MSEX009419 [Manduca sexta]
MWNNSIVSEKKKALLSHKQKVLEEIKYYEKRIEDERNKGKIEYYVDDASSDSDDDLCLSIEQGHSLTQLKLEQSKLRTCLQATHELTSLQILQSEVNIIVNEPVTTGEPPVKQPGTWREVTAECRIDLVPFSITFYAHKSNAKFGATSYRGLNVVLVKAAHEAELSASVLPTLLRPSDAVQILRSYAEAYRSRRSTLACLAKKYADSLYMEPLVEGGYLLKCGNLLQVAWRLENKWSPLAPFYHRMKFDLEYMEEKYINIITQCHKQLSDPTISTDERSLLLSKIIATCLEANPVSESAESDRDSRVPKRRATLDQEIEEPENKKKKEVMAPPRSLPKKAKVTKAVSKNSRSNDDARNKDMAGNLDADKENENSNLMGNTKTVTTKNVGSRESVVSGSKTGQKTLEKASKNASSTKSVDVAKENNIENTVTDPKIKNKQPNSAPQTKNLEIQSDTADKVIEKSQSVKKTAMKDKSKKVSEKDKAATESNKKTSKDAVGTKGIKPDAQVDPMSNKKKHSVTKNIANDAKVEKSASKKTSKVSEKSPEGQSSDNANENIVSAKNSNKVKKPVTNKKLSKENTRANNAQTVQSSGKGKKVVTNTTEKPQHKDSAQKVVEKNVNNKIKDNIADIAKKVTNVKNVDSVKDEMPIKRILHNSNDPIISQTEPYDIEDPAIMQAVTQPNDVVPAKTKKIINNLQDKNNVNNKIATIKASNNNPKNRQQSTEKKDGASVKSKSSNVEKVSNKKTVGDDKAEKLTNKKIVASDKNKVIKNTNANNLTEKEINNQKPKSQDINSDNMKESDYTKKSVLPLRMQNHLKMTRKSIGNIKASAAKENGVNIKSKIPQKKLSPLNENVMKKNPLRMSPRHMAATFNSTSSSVKQSAQKSTTNIPRLAKPMMKAK